MYTVHVQCTEQMSMNRSELRLAVNYDSDSVVAVRRRTRRLVCRVSIGAAAAHEPLPAVQLVRPRARPPLPLVRRPLQPATHTRLPARPVPSNVLSSRSLLLFFYSSVATRISTRRDATTRAKCRPLCLCPCPCPCAKSLPLQCSAVQFVRIVDCMR